MDIQKRLEEHWKAVSDLGYNIMVLALQGSQNYNLDYEGSDIDTKAIVLPTLDDIVLNKPLVSFTHVMENNEHVDVKDIRLMFGCFKKQNINFLEILFTPYYLTSWEYADMWAEARVLREDIARYDENKAVNCMCGMAMEKYKAMEHPYPAIMDKIEKYGYDGKQLHHIVRMRHFLEGYMSGESFASLLEANIGERRQFLMKLKLNELPLETARTLAKGEMDLIAKLKASWNTDKPVREEVEAAMNKIVTKAVTKSLKAELLGESYD